MARKGITMSLADAEAHQARHFGTRIAQDAPKAAEPVKVPKPRQNKTEAEYGLVLEAMKRRGEIVDYRPFGIKLEWGADPVTGKPMVYSPDWFAIDAAFRQNTYISDIRLIEIKGGYIRPQDLIRFKGCRAEWPMFRFELHQKAEGQWRRLF